MFHYTNYQNASNNTYYLETVIHIHRTTHRSTIPYTAIPTPPETSNHMVTIKSQETRDKYEFCFPYVDKCVQYSLRIFRRNPRR